MPRPAGGWLGPGSGSGLGLRLALGLGLRLGLGSVAVLKDNRCPSPPDIECFVVEPEECEEGRAPRGAGWAVGIQHKLRAPVRWRRLDRQQPHRGPKKKRQGGGRRRWFVHVVRGVTILITCFQARGGRHASHRAAIGTEGEQPTFVPVRETGWHENTRCSRPRISLRLRLSLLHAVERSISLPRLSINVS